jgi:hypothetical protein
MVVDFFLARFCDNLSISQISKDIVELYVFRVGIGM